jgi:hypothetical protein
MASSINASTSGAGGVITTADNTGILNLQTASTTAVTVDASQNVGIGTTSPGQKLDVSGSTTSDIYRLRSNQTAPSSTDAFIYRPADNAIALGTNSTERMRIDSSGNVLVGATSNPSLSWTTANKLFLDQSTADFVCHIRHSSTTSTNNYGLAMSYAATPNNTGQPFIDIRDSTAKRFEVRSNGGINNFSANNTNLSDQREKTNIELAGSYLDKVCAIPVKTFNYIDQNMEEDGGLTLGVIAQDVQAIAPELVTESNWGTEEEPKQRLSIYQTDLQYALMKCIQEQQTIINDLKARVTALEAK